MTAVSAVVFSVITVALIGWADYNGIRHLEVFALILVMLGVYIWWCVVMFRRADDTVTVGSGGLVYRAPGRPPVSLPWSSVQARAHDRRLHLEITDRRGVHPGRIRLGYQIEHFGRLIHIIRERTAPPLRTGPPQRVFVRSVSEITGPLHWPLAFIGVAIWLWRMGQPRAALFTTCGILWSIGSAVQQPWRVRILDDALAIDYLGRSRRIALAEVTDVQLHEYKEYGKGRPRLDDIQAVDVVTVHGTLRLAGYRDGSLALYRALDDVWRAATAR